MPRRPVPVFSWTKVQGNPEKDPQSSPPSNPTPKQYHHHHHHHPQQQQQQQHPQQQKQQQHPQQQHPQQQQQQHNHHHHHHQQQQQPYYQQQQKQQHHQQEQQQLLTHHLQQRQQQWEDNNFTSHRSQMFTFPPEQHLQPPRRRPTPVFSWTKPPQSPQGTLQNPQGILQTPQGILETTQGNLQDVSIAGSHSDTSAVPSITDTGPGREPTATLTHRDSTSETQLPDRSPTVALPDRSPTVALPDGSPTAALAERSSSAILNEASPRGALGGSGSLNRLRIQEGAYTHPWSAPPLPETVPKRPQLHQVGPNSSQCPISPEAFEASGDGAWGMGKRTQVDFGGSYWKTGEESGCSKSDSSSQGEGSSFLPPSPSSSEGQPEIMAQDENNTWSLHMAQDESNTRSLHMAQDEKNTWVQDRNHGVNSTWSQDIAQNGSSTWVLDMDRDESSTRGQDRGFQASHVAEAGWASVSSLPTAQEEEGQHQASLAVNDVSKLTIAEDSWLRHSPEEGGVGSEAVEMRSCGKWRQEYNKGGFGLSWTKNSDSMSEKGPATTNIELEGLADVPLDMVAEDLTPAELCSNGSSRGRDLAQGVPGNKTPGKGSTELSAFSFNLGAAAAWTAVSQLQLMASGWWAQSAQKSQGVKNCKEVTQTRRDKGLSAKRRKTLSSLQIELDPSKKVQWFGQWEEGELLPTRSKTAPLPGWTEEDVVVLPGLSGKVPTPALINNVPALFMTGFLLCLCGGVFVSLPFWATDSWLAFWIASVLSLRAAILTCHALNMWIIMEGTEIELALSYPWLDVCTACLALGLHLQSVSSLPICIGSWLAARGLWLEGMALICGWNEKGREWWLSLVAIWPPVLVGSLLIAGLPLDYTWYTTAVMAACCLVDGVPVWATSVLVKVQLLNGDGYRPEYARSFVDEALGVGCLLQGVLRMVILVLCTVGFYVAWK